jgi:cytochrome c biogenesis protein CcmG, thiol:disulfide interchange protein DsbE
MRTCFFALALLVSTMIFAQDRLPSTPLTNLDNQPVSLDSIVGKGKLTVISFWATWCAPCKKELDAIADVYPDWIEAYDVQIIALSIDDARTSTKVKPMVSQKMWDYMVLLDVNKDFYNALNISNVPYTILVDRQGNIVWRHSGYVPGGEAELEEKLKELTPGK